MPNGPPSLLSSQSPSSPPTLPSGTEAMITAGIGEHAPAIRERICAKLRWLGLELDPEANAVSGPRTSMAQSRIAVWVIPTDEEGVIATHTLVATASRR